MCSVRGNWCSDDELRYRILRPPERFGNAFPDRVVGALQLLRHAGIADPVHGRAGSSRRHGLSAGGSGRNLWPLHRHGLSGLPAGRLGGGPRPGCAPRGADWRHYHYCRALLSGFASYEDLLPGAGVNRDWHRLAEAEYQRYGRRALPWQRSASRCRVFHLLYRHQHRFPDCAAGVQLSGRARQLALRLWVGGHRHGRWRDSICLRPEASR